MLTEIVVTPEMIAAGLGAFETVGDVGTECLVEIIYRTMAVEAPTCVDQPTLAQ